MPTLHEKPRIPQRFGKLDLDLRSSRSGDMLQMEGRACQDLRAPA